MAPARMTAASSSHAVVLTVIGCGSGGGAGRAPLAGGPRGLMGRRGRRFGALRVLAHRAPSFLGSTQPRPIKSGVDPVCGNLPIMRLPVRVD